MPVTGVGGVAGLDIGVAGKAGVDIVTLQTEIELSHSAGSLY